LNSRKRMLEDLEQDIRDHIAADTRDNVERGMTVEDARYAALRKFGNVRRVREDTREVWSFVRLEQLLQDARFGMRMLRKSPGFTAVAVLTLSLGIGANTVVFSVVNSFLFKPLPVRDPGRLVVVAYHDPKLNYPHEVSNADLQDFRAHSEVTSDMTAFLINFAGLSADNRSERVLVTYAKGDYFSALGIQPAFGRVFLPGEGEVAGADAVIVLGYSHWRRRFGGDPAVVGGSVNLDGRPVTIIGVAPKTFFGTFYIVGSDAYAPLGMFAGSAGMSDILTDRKDRQLRVLAHLRPGVSIEQAGASLQVIAAISRANTRKRTRACRWT
jgi:hypothetical protein